MSPGALDGVDEEAAAAVRELYAGPPGEFTAGRDRLAQQAREAGDRELAASLKALKRPVVAAWAVNLLVQEEADLVDQVLQVGEALREAQENLAGDALRELGRQRRRLIDSVVARARALASEHGQRLTGQAEQQVAATLHAALADADAAQAVLGGLLVKPLESTGLGSVDLADHVAGTAAAPAAGSAKSRPRKKSRAGSDEESRQAQLREQAEERRRLKREAAEQQVREAEQTLADAERARDAVREQHEEARAHVLHLEARIDELRRQLSDLESEAEEASEAAEAREEELEHSGVEAEDARQALEAARSALAELG